MTKFRYIDNGEDPLGIEDFYKWKEKLKTSGIMYTVSGLGTGNLTILFYFDKILTGDINFNKLFDIVEKLDIKAKLIRLGKNKYKLTCEIKTSSPITLDTHVDQNKKLKEMGSEEGSAMQEQIDHLLHDYYKRGIAKKKGEKIAEAKKKLDEIN